MNYIIAEQGKKASGLKIGIFTVFLVVSMITMLESVISITPILFVNLGQDESGAIDFSLKFDKSNLANGDVNLYAQNPFRMNYSLNYSYEPLVANKAPPLFKKSKLQAINPATFVTNEGDHYLIEGEVPVLNFDWYKEKLSGLSGFNGFTPRTLYPNSVFSHNSLNVTNLLLVIDCKQEVQIGLAPEFNPYILGLDEVMVNSGTVQYLGLQLGDSIDMEIDIGIIGPVATSSTPMQQVMGLLYASLGREMGDMVQMTRSNLGSSFTRTMTVTADYTDSAGKFPSAYGNVAILDCHYILNYIFDYARNDYAPTLPLAERVIFIAEVNKLENELAQQGITWCSFAYEIDGVLTNQASYYMSMYQVIYAKILAKSIDIVNAIGITANSSVSAPMRQQFSKTKLMSSFLSAALIIVICFLAILSSQLLYSLMLSDVDQKTYEYGMLRALGFQSSHLVSMITIQSFFFSIPGVALGIAVAVVLNLLLRYFIYIFAANTASFALTTTALWIGIVFGLVMPLLSILLPI
jgi:ABC-type antimicrobial peptide transport system permease subunit